MKSIYPVVMAAALLQLSGCHYYGQGETYSSLENINQETNYISPAPGVSNMTSAPQTITPQEAEHMMISKNVIILDVRTPGEFKEGHIINAVLLPLDKIREHAEAIIPDKNYTLLIYCRSGNRSNQAALLLSEMGYLSVYDFGGIINWHREVVMQ